MSLLIYKISNYNHKAEENQFESIVKLLTKRFGQSKKKCILIGNYNIEGVELDALLITSGGFRILEFKNWGGKIIARENGSWTSDGLIIGGGARNRTPFEQIRINKSRVSKGIAVQLGIKQPLVSATIIFREEASIDDSQISKTVKQWLTICNNNQLEIILNNLGSDLLTEDLIGSIPKRLYLDEFKTDPTGKQILADTKDVYAPETAENFFDELKSAISNTSDIHKVYKKYQRTLMKFLDERTASCQLTFAGPFAKMDYLLKENEAKWWLIKAANDARTRIRKSKQAKEDKLRSSYLFDLKYLCQFIAFVDDVDIPSELINLFPKEKDTKHETKSLRDSMRMIVSAWDDNYVYGEIEDYSENRVSKVTYTNTYPTFPHDWSYLKTMFYNGAQLNLIRPHLIEKGIIQPELIIFEPDYLVNVTTIARCLTNYADSPYVNLVHKIESAPESWSIILGNFAGQILDEELSGNSCIVNGSFSKTKYGKSLRKFFNHNALGMLTAAKPNWNFHEEAAKQASHIHKAITESLPQAVGGFNTGEGIVEPSFYSEMLGIQGRMDFLQMNYRFLVEQKSGKGGFPYDNFIIPKWTDEHFAQLQLYMLLFRYNYRDKFKKANYDLSPILMYSKYEKGLLRITMIPEKVFDTIKIRNGIAWIEMLLTQHDGYRFYDSLTPEKLNMKKKNDNLWNNFQYPQLTSLLNVIHSATDLEKAYFFRFMTFISNEHVMSKLGNKTKECSSFSSTWHDALDTKRLAGNIYNDLTLIYPDSNTKGEITYVDLLFPDDIDNDMSNFRQGDIVILYPYEKNTEPDATNVPVIRCTIKEITKDNHVILTLRHPQSDNRIFMYESEKMWAIEHDLMEASYSGLYYGMYSFLTAPKERKDLLLFQRKPEVDNSVELRGNYGCFNQMALQVKKAKDFFLIIGPPGTGKTSYGLLNTLKEELLEPGTSVLLMSYTNRAVDEICSKLKEANIDFIRIGGDMTASPEYKENLISEKIGHTGKLSDVKQMLINNRVYVGTTTALNSHLNIFQLKHFDLAIIDEASQILEPHLMGLLSAQYNGRPAISKFVMIGDHKQLPAVVQQTSETSKVQEPILQDICLYDCRYSLFERLLRKYHDDRNVVYMLTKQGRMHPDIAAFPNYTFYNGQLKAVPLPHQEKVLPYCGQGKDGLTDLLKTRRIAFISSDMPSESPSDKVNPVEAEMIAATVRRIYELEKDFFSAEETVGVIVPYRNQISAVRKVIDKYDIDILHNITIDTVERFQGSQRKYIIYGFTIQEYYQLNFLTSNVFTDVDGTIVDRKLNVAMTRAEDHLIMIGNAPLLENNIIFSKLIEFVKSRYGYFEIGKDDYIKGNFKVIDYSPDSLDLSRATFTLTEEFRDIFNKVITLPIKEASGSEWPDKIFGNDMPTNLDAIAYGRIDFSNELQMFGGMTPERQVYIYCYYIMRQHYCSIRNILTSYKSWINGILKSVNNRLQIIDIGCGPATCGIAFGEEFGDIISNMTYNGIDVSIEMKKMGRHLLTEMFGNSLKCSMLSSFNELNTEFWQNCSSEPSLVIINMSYFFSNVNAQFTQQLAKLIIDVMGKYPLNKYVIMIQQSKIDKGINSYKVFKRVLESHIQVVKDESSTFSYMLSLKRWDLPFCYEILKRG